MPTQSKLAAWGFLGTVAVLAATASVAGKAAAQEAQIQFAAPAGAQADLSKLPPEVRARIEAQMKARGGQPQSVGQPKGEEKKEDGKEDDGKAKEEKPDEGVKTVKRPTEPPKGDAKELRATVDPDGKVQFSFRGQPWPEVMQWFSEVANLSLDWQELPADYLNLVTQRRYTIPETRDLLNRHLLARGFTMLVQGEVLTVVKVDKLDPSLIPRVSADDLEDHLPHDFVRVRFDVPATMEPEKAQEDAKTLLSPAAKVTPLLASRQLLVIDVVSNLRDVRDMLYGEQIAASNDLRPQQFQIRYRRADYIAEQIMVTLGLDPNARKMPMEVQMQQQQQRMAMMQQMAQQQQRGGGGAPDMSKLLKPQGPEVYIAVDVRRNTISVNAAPKEMKIIERIIEQFDVPANGKTFAAGDELYMEKHQTVTVDPEGVITALKEIGDLNPLTQLRGDEKTKTIFAMATKADHETIKRMIDKLDGSGRSLRVVWLSRRTPADQIAGTIKALMVGEPKNDDNNRRSWYYDYWNRDDDDDEEDAGFRIQADVENNRLLLWANDSEYAEVADLLEKLGAVAPNNGGNPNTFRVLEPRDPEATAELLERLKATWGGRNPLNINAAPPESTVPSKEAPAASPEAAGGEDPQEEKESDRLTRVVPVSPRRVSATFVQAAQPAEEHPSAEPAATNESGPAEATSAATAAEDEDNRESAAPPINVTVTPDGRIVVSSQDVTALDQMEDLIEELSPAQQDYAIFPLKNSLASSVSYNLEEYFADELAEDDDPFARFFGGGSEDEAATLGKRRKLRFIWDPDTNTILVQNASPAQLDVIRKLINIYDQPVSEESVARRQTKIVQIRYSKAQDIATALKEVFRDLLSSKDKEFQQDRGDGDRRTRVETRYRFYGSGDDDNKKSAPVKMAFEGALSIGVDQVSNTLIISAEEQVWQIVEDIVRQLDEQARPNTVVQVHRLNGSLSGSELQRALATALSAPWPGGKPDASANQNRSGDRGGDSDSRRRWRDRDGDRDGDRDRRRRDND